MRNHGGSPCSVCVHPQRKEIESALVEKNTPLRLVSKQFGPGYSAIWRHKQHIAAPVVRAANAAKDIVREKLEADLDCLILRTRRLLTSAQRGRNVAPQLSVIGRMQSLLELKAKVLGKIDEGPRSELHVHVSAEKALAIAQVYVQRHDGKPELPIDFG